MCFYLLFQKMILFKVFLLLVLFTFYFLGGFVFNFNVVLFIFLFYQRSFLLHCLLNYLFLVNLRWYLLHFYQTHWETPNFFINGLCFYDSCLPFQMWSHPHYYFTWSVLFITSSLVNHLFQFLNSKLESLDLPFESNRPCYSLTRKVMKLLICLQNTPHPIKSDHLLPYNLPGSQLLESTKSC